jgi:hypothetical protein
LSQNYGITRGFQVKTDVLKTNSTSVATNITSLINCYMKHIINKIHKNLC